MKLLPKTPHKKSKNIKKVLFVSYVAPPVSSPGSLRIKFLAKYFPEFGLYPIILTAKNSYSSMISDDVYLENVNDFDIIKAQDPFGNLKRNFNKNATKSTSQQSSKTSLLKRLLTYFKPYPDHNIVWLPFAILKGIERLLKKDVAIIYSTYPSLTNHLVGLILSSCFRIEWYVEFRDLFTSELSYKHKGLRKYIDKYLEGLILSKASKIVVVSKGLKEDLVKNNNEFSKKTIIIYNGFDIAEFDKKNLISESVLNSQNISNHPIYWLYSGSFLSGARNPEPILKALYNLNASKEITPDTFCLLYAGNDHHSIIKPALEIGVNTYVKHLGMLPRKKVLTLMTQVDRLLTISRSGIQAKSELTTKLFEYIGSGTPLLTITDESFELSDITKEMHGIVADFNDNITIEKTILNDMKTSSLEKKNLIFTKNNQYLNSYSRYNQSKILALDIIDFLSKETSS